jgi:hypothetical protein
MEQRDVWEVTVTGHEGCALMEGFIHELMDNVL